MLKDDARPSRPARGASTSAPRAAARRTRAAAETALPPPRSHATPAGAWVAEDDGGLRGRALALKREGIWGLSLLVVGPEHAVGRRRLRAARARARRTRDGRRAARSSSPRPTRARCAPTRGSGFAAAPAASTPRARRAGSSAPGGVRDGDAGDIARDRDRRPQRARRGRTAATSRRCCAPDCRLLVIAERGYAVFGDGSVRMLAAFDEDGGGRAAARRARPRRRRGDRGRVDHRRASSGRSGRASTQGSSSTRHGAVFVGGDVGPFRPYLPSGAFL